MATKLKQPLDDDPSNPKVAASALDFLLIELVPLAQRITEQLHAREQVLRDEYKRSRLFTKTSNPTTTQLSTRSRVGGGDEESGVTVTDGSVKDSSVAVGGGGGGGTGGITSLGFPSMSETTREAVLWRLDGLGYRVGQGLVER